MCFLCHCGVTNAVWSFMMNYVVIYLIYFSYKCLKNIFQRKQYEMEVC